MSVIKGYQGNAEEGFDFVADKDAFDYALDRCMNNAKDNEAFKKEFGEYLVDWFFSSNWVRTEREEKPCINEDVVGKASNVRPLRLQRKKVLSPRPIGSRSFHPKMLRQSKKRGHTRPSDPRKMHTGPIV